MVAPAELNVVDLVQRFDVKDPKNPAILALEHPACLSQFLARCLLADPHALQ